MAKELERLNVNIPADLMRRVEEYADRYCLNKTSAVTMLLSQSLEASKAMSTLNDLMAAFNEQKSKSNLPEGDSFIN